MTEILHLCARNDLNGNPRRVYVLRDTESGKYLAAWDEGYKGSDAVPGELRKAAYHSYCERIKVSEYKQLLRTLPSPDYAYEVEGYSHLR